jgi:hypothetical protein
MEAVPPDYRIDRSSRRVLSEVRGVYSFEVAVGRMRRLLADPEFDPAFDLLMDFREAAAMELTHDEIVEMTNIRVFSDDSRRAYVVSTPEQFGLARMFSSYRVPGGSEAYRVFTDMGEALAWLDLGRSPAPPPGP